MRRTRIVSPLSGSRLSMSLFIDLATAGDALPGSTDRGSHLATGRADRPRRQPCRAMPNISPTGAKVAIFDPELILPDVLQHLREQAPLLGMAILVQKHVGNQHALLIQHHQRLPR